MKVLIISAHPLYDNRISKHISTCLKYGVKVEYFNISVSDTKMFPYSGNPNVTLIHCHNAVSKTDPAGALKSFFKLYRYVSNSDADIVHVHDPSLLFIAKKANRSNKRVVFDKHERFEEIDCLNAKYGAWNEKHYKSTISAEVCVNDSLADYIYKLRKESPIIVPNYQLFSKYRQSDTKKHSDGIIRSAFIAQSLSAESTLDGKLLFDVLDIVFKNSSNFEFTIVGNSDYYKDRKQQLQDKYPGRFHDLGVIPYDKVVELNNLSDIGLLFYRDVPNAKRCSPNKLSEYLLSSQVIFSVGDFADSKAIENCDCIKLHKFGTQAETIANEILDLLNDIKRIETLQAESNRTGALFSWENYENRYYELYCSLLGK